MMKQLAMTVSLALAAQAAQAGDAGKIIFVAGAAQVAEKPAVLGAAVAEGELLTTGGDGYMYIKTPDNGLFILRPKTQARIAVYQVDKVNPANTKVKLELISGVARSQSGEAVKLARQNFRFNTPVAAIGVRGTDFTVFTDQNTSRVAVISGRVTVSGFDGACRPEGGGPCESNAARELAAAQKGVLLQVQRGQAAPQLMQGNNLLAPDVVAPPRNDEPVGGKGAASNEPSLDAKKNVSLQEKAQQQNKPPTVKEENEGGGVPPLVVKPDPKPPVVEPQPVVPMREVSWGRWSTALGETPTSGMRKDGSDTIAMTEDFALFRERKGNAFVIPEKGAIGLSLAEGAAYVRDMDTGYKFPAEVKDGTLRINFDQRTFATGFNVLSAGQSHALAANGYIQKDGIFSVMNQNLPTSNMSVDGVLKDMENATYLFQGGIPGRRVVNGVTVWKK